MFRVQFTSEICVKHTHTHKSRPKFIPFYLEIAKRLAKVHRAGDLARERLLLLLTQRLSSKVSTNDTKVFLKVIL